MNVQPADVVVFNRARLMLFSPNAPVEYCSDISDRLIPVPTRGIGDKFACDEQFRVFFDPDRKVSQEEFNADLLHEVIVHLLANHFVRGKLANLTDHDLANIAGDEAGNQIVFAIAAKFPDIVQPGGVRFPSANSPDAVRASKWLHPLLWGHPEGRTMEVYYELHAQERQAQPPPQPQPQQGQGQGQPQSGGGSPQSKPSQGGAQPPQGGKAGPAGAPSTGAGKSPVGKGKCGGCAAGHTDADIIEKAKAQHGELPNGPTSTEADSVRKEAAKKAVAAARGEGRGFAPAGLTRECEGILEPPKVRWQETLRSVIANGVEACRGADDYSFSKFRERGEFFLPRTESQRVTVAVVADTSGSMGEADLLRVLSETSRILRLDSVGEVWWVPTDARAEKATPLKTIAQARDRMHGGGGTNMGEGLRAAATIKPNRPDVTIVVTDGDTDWPSARPTKCGKVIVALTRRSGCPTPAWAKVVHAY